MSLRNSFKNFRRDYPDASRKRSCSQTSADSGVEPQSKHLRTTADEGEELSDKEYKEAIEELGAELKKGRKGGRNQATVKELMEKTRKRRRRWIEQDRPLIWEVLDVFPCLGSSRGVSVFNCICTHLDAACETCIQMISTYSCVVSFE